MPNYTIGLNAISTAQKLIDVAGDNIANANTEGYAAKRADVVAVTGPVTGISESGLGSTVAGVQRMRDMLIEAALLQHVQTDQRLNTEVNNLGTLESFFTEPTDGGIDALLGGFFDSVDALTASPDDPALREQVVQKAQAVCDAFNRLDSEFTTVTQNLTDSTQSTVESINSLTQQIAYYNGRIRVSSTSGGSAPTLEDQRDQLVTQLAQLINITVRPDQYGVVNISASGTLIVDGQNSIPLSVTQKDGGLTVAPTGAQNFAVDVRGGQLGGLLNLSQDLVPRYRDALDELAGDFRRAVNMVQTTGVGLNGRFTSLQGQNFLDYDRPLSDVGYGVPAGTDEKLVINVADSATGDVRQYRADPRHHPDGIRLPDQPERRHQLGRGPSERHRQRRPHPAAVGQRLLLRLRHALRPQPGRAGRHHRRRPDHAHHPGRLHRRLGPDLQVHLPERRHGGHGPAGRADRGERRRRQRPAHADSPGGRRLHARQRPHAGERAEVLPERRLGCGGGLLRLHRPHEHGHGRRARRAGAELLPDRPGRRQHQRGGQHPGRQRQPGRRHAADGRRQPQPAGALAGARPERGRLRHRHPERQLPQSGLRTGHHVQHQVRAIRQRGTARQGPAEPAGRRLRRQHGRGDGGPGAARAPCTRAR